MILYNYIFTQHTLKNLALLTDLTFELEMESKHQVSSSNQGPSNFRLTILTITFLTVFLQFCISIVFSKYNDIYISTKNA